MLVVLPLPDEPHAIADAGPVRLSKNCACRIPISVANSLLKASNSGCRAMKVKTDRCCQSHSVVRNDQLMAFLARRPITDTLTYNATSNVAYEIPRRMPPSGVGRGAEITQASHGSSLSRTSTDMASERHVFIDAIGTVRRFTRSSGRLAWRRTLGSLRATGTQETHGAGDDLDGDFLAVLL